MKSGYFISFGLLFQLSSALYRQWIPDTNFNNNTNWDKGRIPCKNDRVLFHQDKSLSIFMQSPLELMEMYLPLDGEFILSHGAGFAASDGQSVSGCERGEDITFKDPSQYKWYDPKYWHTTLSMSDLENEKHLFILDEERVPCQYDDVIFRPETSFRVDLDSDIQNINVKTISLMNMTFASNEEFAEYMWSNTGKLQFQGNGSITVTNAKCEDKSGCDCGNFGNHRRICSNLQKESGSQCSELICTNPLKPLGHCCDICGAIIYFEYGPEFDLELYQAHLFESFLSLNKYQGVRTSVTKVYKKQSSKKTVLADAAPHIQIVFIDNETESATGRLAAALAQDVMGVITTQGDKLGITNAELQESTNSEQQAGRNMNDGEIIATVAGVVIAVLLSGSLVFLIISGRMRVNVPLCLIYLKSYFTSNHEVTIDNEFSNVTFGSPSNLPHDSNGICSGEQIINIVAHQSGTNIMNPAFGQGFDEENC
ncbi:protein amnionless [Stegostoma tigrinum]|uniref:protein amnionless n=1 Tax=Stegostoma tigrinum TaxID=3053191 RepID=UPI00202B02FA|nr:protein amnionless [Stegostoma tigrinum]XP_048393011.1 protein amnionless [Stegostoma tigrinum]